MIEKNPIRGWWPGMWSWKEDTVLNSLNLFRKSAVAGKYNAILGKPRDEWQRRSKFNNIGMLLGHHFLDCQPEGTDWKNQCRADQGHTYKINHDWVLRCL